MQPLFRFRSQCMGRASLAGIRVLTSEKYSLIRQFNCHTTSSLSRRNQTHVYSDPRKFVTKRYCNSTSEEAHLNSTPPQNNLSSNSTFHTILDCHNVTLYSKENVQCRGCGVSLQADDEQRSGYVPKHVLEQFAEIVKSKEANAIATQQERANVICRRCYRLHHHNEHLPHQTELNDDICDAILSPLRDPNHSAVVLVVVDLLDVDGSLHETLHEFIGEHHSVVLALNKRDLLPPGATDRRLQEWIRHRMNKLPLNGEEWPLKKCVRAVHVVSARSGLNVDKLIGSLKRLRRYKDPTRPPRDVVIIGCTNSGKSTLVNRITREITGKSMNQSQVVTTSSVPGTTLSAVGIAWTLVKEKDDTPTSPDVPLLIDTPGLLARGQAGMYLKEDDLQLLCPNRSFRARTYRVRREKCFLLGGIVRIDVDDCDTRTADNHLLLTVFADPRIQIHHTNVLRAAEVRERFGGTKMLSPPSSEERFALLPPLKRHELECVSGDDWKVGAADIVLPGLGWIAVNLVGRANLSVWTPQGMRCSLRDCLMPFELPRTRSTIVRTRPKHRAGTWNNNRKGKRRK